MKQTLSKGAVAPLLRRLRTANERILKVYPGDSVGRQPVHTVYGGAQLFTRDIADKLGKGARKALAEHAPDPEQFGNALGLSEKKGFRRQLYERVVLKLMNEPVEDFRIDFEDGYGVRPDAEEDKDAVRTANEVAQGFKERILPPFIGIRIKSLTEELKFRSIRTLDLFVTQLVHTCGKKLPENFVITLPKITSIDQVKTAVSLVELLERKLKLPAQILKMELMVETPQTLFDVEGRVILLALIRSGKGRIRGAHFGTYDFTASNDITAAYQTMDHPVCDFAHFVMKNTLSGTSVWLSDGATNVMPVGTKEEVHWAWKTSYDHIRYSLKKGLYQGWDLHPAQLPVRYAALYSFFLEGMDLATARLKAFMGKAAQATLLGNVFDDAATGQGLINYFLRGLCCGAITENEAKATGLTPREIEMRSFVKILAERKKSK